MRRDYALFQDQNCEILAIANDTLETAQTYFRRYRLPFPGLIDVDHKVYDLYGVESRLLSLGQRPALFIVDTSGVVRYAYLGTQQWEIPSNREVLDQLAAL